MNAAKQRAEQLGLPFDLHEHADDMKKRISALKCELTGLPLKVNGGRRQFNSVSIDRIDPSAGYVYENVRVIAWSLNAAFGNWGEDAFSAVAEAWLAGRKKKVEEDA